MKPGSERRVIITGRMTAIGMIRIPPQTAIISPFGSTIKWHSGKVEQWDSRKYIYEECPKLDK